MHQGTTIVSAAELFGDCANLSESQGMKDDFETCWEWPEKFGNGIMSLVHLRPGIYLEIGNFRLQKDIAIRFEQVRHSITFGFSISGNIRYTTDSEQGHNEYWGYKQGRSVAYYQSKHQQNIIRPSVGTRAYYVGIIVDPLLLKTYMAGQHDQMPVGLRNIVEGAEEQHFHQISMISPVVNKAIRQIISCPYRSSLKRLFLEGKVLELISYSLAQFESSADALQKDAELPSDDIERVLEARDILIRNLEDPPSLQTLAREVGTNKTTLSKGFRKLFGASAFEYLRTCRLERARELLESKEMNVTEAAYSVGYAQHSSFTKAFKKHFGTNPTDHLH